MKLYREKAVRPTIPTASMADIAFLLIIFFMLTTSFSPVKTSVELPESLERSEVDPNAAIVAISAQHELVFSDGESPGVDLQTPDQLGSLIEQVVMREPNKQFIIRADRFVPYRNVDEVLEALRSHGAREIGLLTEQKTPRRGGR
ncbi:MAG: biopolymer transporter ExbD [Acidobacteria bacterium]|nr:biopolymer transporter ExbD [Acidobacteriota bacterium]